MLHVDLCALAAGEKGGAERDGLDLRAVELDVVGESLKVDLAQDLFAGGR